MRVAERVRPRTPGPDGMLEDAAEDEAPVVGATAIATEEPRANLVIDRVTGLSRAGLPGTATDTLLLLLEAAALGDRGTTGASSKGRQSKCAGTRARAGKHKASCASLGREQGASTLSARSNSHLIAVDANS